MSITVETAKDHAKDPAVLCCRVEEGVVLTPANLEDPVLFPDFEDSGLLTIPANCLTIEQVLGAKLTKTLDSLTPITADDVDAVQAGEAAPAASAPAQAQAPIQEIQGATFAGGSGGTIKIHIEEGRGIHLEIPTSQVQGSAPVAGSPVMLAAGAASAAPAGAPYPVRQFTRKHFNIQKVEFGDATKIEGTTLTIRNSKEICAEAIALHSLVEDLSLEIITPDNYKIYSETIMDVQPIATKEEGDIGHGITRVLDNVVMVLTGTDANGVQIGEFGSSEGELDRNIMWGRPGAPDHGDILIKAQVTIKAGTNMERKGPLAAHKAADYVTEEIRKVLKEVSETLVTKSDDIVQYRRPGKPKVLIVKEIMGQGAMHDNLIMPVEPVGTLGAKPNVDLGNLPIMLSPTEVLDGGIHALTCIGPASKECSRHYYREPLVVAALADEDIDVVGVMFVGSPQANSEKFYVSKRLGMTVEAMGIDGAIVTTEGFGNNHIDFASHIEEIGKRGIKVVGCSYSAVQGALVVGNKYMEAMVDNNKSMQGIENEILANNTLCPEDAVRIMAMLKTIMSGGKIKTAERKWTPTIKQNNIEAIEKADNIKITLVDNEQSLEKSKKRLEIYEKE